MPAAAFDYVELELYRHDKCHRAFLVSRSGDAERAAWLDFKDINVLGTTESMIRVRMSRALARQRGLV